MKAQRVTGWWVMFLCAALLVYGLATGGLWKIWGATALMGVMAVVMTSTEEE